MSRVKKTCFVPPARCRPDQLDTWNEAWDSLPDYDECAETGEIYHRSFGHWVCYLLDREAAKILGHEHVPQDI